MRPLARYTRPFDASVVENPGTVVVWVKSAERSDNPRYVSRTPATTSSGVAGAAAPRADPPIIIITKREAVHAPRRIMPPRPPEPRDGRAPRAACRRTPGPRSG